MLLPFVFFEPFVVNPLSLCVLGVLCGNFPSLSLRPLRREIQFLWPQTILFDDFRRG